MNNKRYSLQVYDTEHRKGSDAILSLWSDTPFMAVHVGDYIELDGWNFPDAIPGKGRFKVVEVEHSVWNNIDPRHVVYVYVTYEEAAS